MLFSTLNWEPVKKAPLFIHDVNDIISTWKQYTHWKNLNDYCVYVYLREESDEHGPKYSIRYVGEGQPKRIISKNHRVRIPISGEFIFVVDGLTKKEVRDIEEKIIQVFGRISKGTGILENLKHKCGGQEDPVPPRKKELCQYCGNEYAHLQFHERHCDKNIDREYGTKTYQYTKCQYCGDEFTINQAQQHERSCKRNPDPKPSSHKMLSCKFCDREVLSSAMPQHERTCAKNPNRVAGPGTGNTFSKIQCSMCDRMVAYNNIAIHERSCKNNPNRVPGVRYGKTSKKINTFAE
jgi:hypothetical protein